MYQNDSSGKHQRCNSGDPRIREDWRPYLIDFVKTVMNELAKEGRVDELRTLLYKLEAKIGRVEVLDIMHEHLDENINGRMKVKGFSIPCYYCRPKRRGPLKFKVSFLYGPDEFWHLYDHPTPSDRETTPEHMPGRNLSDLGKTPPNSVVKHFSLLADVCENFIERLDSNIHFDDDIHELSLFNAVFGKLIIGMGSKRHNQTTPLIEAIRRNRVQVIKMLIEEFGVNVNANGFSIMFDQEFTPLTIAVRCKNIKLVETLLDKGAEINSQFSNPLRAACRKKHIELIKFLLENGAEMHTRDEMGETCLEFAIRSGRTEIVSCLLHYAPPIDRHPEFLRSALEKAVCFGNLAIVQRLASFGVNLHQKNVFMMNPLLIAAYERRTEIFEYFIDVGHYSRHEKIEALELLGSSFAESTSSISVIERWKNIILERPRTPSRSKETVAQNYEECFKYLKQAFLERLKPPILAKIRNMPVRAYDNHIESQTLQELERIKNDPKSLIREALVIRERILGRNTRASDSFILSLLWEYSTSSELEKCSEFLEHISKVVDDGMFKRSKDFKLLLGHFSVVGVRIPSRLIPLTLEDPSEDLKDMISLAETVNRRSPFGEICTC